MNLFAYLDPGSGSLIIQALIAGIVGSSLYFRRRMVSPIQGVWRRVFGKQNDAS